LRLYKNEQTKTCESEDTVKSNEILRGGDSVSLTQMH